MKNYLPQVHFLALFSLEKFMVKCQPPRLSFSQTAESSYFRNKKRWIDLLFINTNVT